MSRSTSFTGGRDRRVALPVGWGIRTEASETRDSAMLADWRTQWSEQGAEIASRICGIERCLDGVSNGGTCPPRLTIFSPAPRRLAG